MTDITSPGAHQFDLESQRTVLLITSRTSTNPPRDHWRWIYVILQVRKLLISSRANKPANRSQTSPQLSSAIVPRPYAIISTGTASPQVSEDVHRIGEDEDSIAATDAKLQHKNIAKIMGDEDFESLQKFGGVQGIAEALDTDLHNGISGDEEGVSCRRAVGPLFITQPPVQGFFKLLLKSSNNCIIFLLLVAAVLSTGFGMKEEGPSTGWYEGAIIGFVIIILVVAPSIRDFWLQNAQSHSMRQSAGAMELAVEVIRGGSRCEVPMSDVVSGDIVCLKRGSTVPGDGLFVSGKFLVSYDGKVATVNDKKPFLFCGSNVAGGNGSMLVTSVGMDTSWGTLMNKVTKSPNQAHLPAQLDKVSTGTQIIGISISILILVVLFSRFMVEREHNHSGLPDLKGKPTLYVTLAIRYWNKKTLSGKATSQGTLACVTMGSVTTICTDKTGILTLKVHKCYIGDKVIETDYVTGIDTHVREALCNGISTPLLTPSSIAAQQRTRSFPVPISIWECNMRF